MSNRTLSNPDTIVHIVTVIMGAVVGLTFLFGFGNVLNLALRLGVPTWVAPLVAPAVDLSVIGLLLGTRYLALNGAPPDQLRPARRLLIFSSLVALALNIADPLIAGQLGKAAFDAVGPLQLIGWAEVGPGLLGALSRIANPVLTNNPVPHAGDCDREVCGDEGGAVVVEPETAVERSARCAPEDLLIRARQEDALHWQAHRRPISADTLRKRLHIGAGRARDLVDVVRSEYRIRADDRSQGSGRLSGAWVSAA
jgi:hypothetical protein